MSKPGMVIALLGAIAAAVLSSCATTSLLNSWVDPDASGKKLGNVLVVGVARSAPARRQFEDGFAKVLATREIGAVTSYAQLPNAAAIDEAAVKPIAQKEKATHVLIVRLVERKIVTTYVPSSRRCGSSRDSTRVRSRCYTNFDQTAAIRPGYTYDTEYVSLETNVYDAATSRILWSGLTRTELGSRLQEQIEEFIEVISSAMIRDKLI